jgi:hypothetical protein
MYPSKIQQNYSAREVEKMGKYKAFEPENEVLGAAVLSFIESVNFDNIKPFLDRYGLTEVDPGAWYPLQLWLDVLSDMDEQSGGGAMFDFVSIGMKIIETAQFPPEFSTLSMKQAIMTANDLYRANMRGGDFGEYIIDQLNDNHLRITTRIPYPDDVAYGQLYGMARRFAPPGVHFTVYYDEDVPRSEQGGEKTIMHVTWK